MCFLLPDLHVEVADNPHERNTKTSKIFHTAVLVTRVTEERRKNTFEKHSERKRTLLEIFCDDVHAGRFYINKKSLYDH